MTVILYAQPYDLSANGFYFESAEEYKTKSAALKNDHGQAVEEFEIQFIDGEDIDSALADAVGLYQGGIAHFFNAVEAWEDWQKTNVIIAIGECGYSFDLASDDPDSIAIDVYEMNSLRELAENFVEEGLFGDISESLQFYIDYEAIARDLGMDYAETEVAGTRLIYRCH